MSAQYDEDIIMRGPEDEEDEEEEVADELGRSFYLASHDCCSPVLVDKEDESEPEEDELEPENEEDQQPAPAKGEKNSQLTVGYKGDRSYVVRGNSIGVFSHTGDQVKYYSTIGGIATPKGNKAINPAQV